MELPPEILKLLQLAAPTLATALGGPLAGAAATVAVSALSKYLSPKIVNSPMGARADEIITAVTNNLDDPELVTNLKTAEEDIRRYEKDMGFKFAELEAKDRTEIRQFQSSAGLANDVFKFGKTVVYIAFGSLFSLCFALLATAFGLVKFPTENANIVIVVFSIISTIIGAFVSWAGFVFSFYYGRSADSDKNAQALQTTLQTQGAQLGQAVAQAAQVAQDAAAKPAQTPQVVVLPSTAAAPAPDAMVMPAGPSRFIGLVEKLLDHEGGYNDIPSDPGGCTNFGITIGTLGDWRSAKVTCQDVHDLTRAEAKEIYFAKYWNAVKADMLPAGVDYMVFDFGVNAGVSRSAKFLQTILAKRDPSLKVDGAIGPLTIATLAKASPRAIVDEFHEAKMAHYRSLPTWQTFGAGWTNRANDVLAQARASLDNAVV